MPARENHPRSSPPSPPLSQRKSAFEVIPKWNQPPPYPGSTTTYPPGYNFILYLKILINWYNTYHPTGHLGTFGSTICYHIFHPTNLAPFHQTTLREHWATQPRVYTCPSCPLPYSSCPHRCFTPHAGKFFGLSNDPTILLDDLLTCFGPENHDLNDHNWGKIPRIEFQSLEQYEMFLLGGLYTMDNNLKRNMETRLFQIHGFYVHFEKMVRELEGGVEGLLELYRGVVDLRNGEGEGRILGGVLEEIRRREKEEVMRKKRRWGDRGNMEEVMVGCDGVSTVSSGSSEGCVGSDKAADNDKRDGGFPSPTKKRKSVGTTDDEEDEDALGGRLLRI
ncbi:uncharacterized protein PODANS_2_12485 [Podospora anserina S mat+]|uniref:Podospora anserina S mat+ genomic DNA chromosome 2, supercontig 2 n=1 Tax=Podospora anserina (strain S / ATCC MYA-4624 / DSM 980 / FGSC 10383) TaxID=515849 RepID=B2B7W5_PODAN|nr:uncharacterized protein PODANS_2_12485 [Podospora anserina S mat+]CAP73894.1 unnamed protein product [Podospora anserina S mat+]